MGASNFELVFISSTWDCTTFHNFLPMFKKKIQKLAGLWLAGEVANHVGIYGSKAAEGLSAFQRRSCYFYRTVFNGYLKISVIISTEKQTITRDWNYFESTFITFYLYGGNFLPPQLMAIAFCHHINHVSKSSPMAPGRFDWDFKYVTRAILVIDG